MFWKALLAPLDGHSISALFYVLIILSCSNTQRMSIDDGAQHESIPHLNSHNALQPTTNNPIKIEHTVGVVIYLFDYYIVSTFQIVNFRFTPCRTPSHHRTLSQLSVYQSASRKMVFFFFKTAQTTMCPRRWNCIKYRRNTLLSRWDIARTNDREKESARQQNMWPDSIRKWIELIKRRERSEKK